MDRAGVSRHVAMQITGHKTESMYRRYNIVGDADLRTAMRRTRQYLDTLPSEKERPSRSAITLADCFGNDLSRG